ncbi:MAG: response regulator transcription factor [Burkholderiales bacterium]|nr:response regulator transcription factor [Burkholderiales bacterium]MCW5604580.1 response regulator transcription factor [Burkholderiales bacterium]
MRILIAEDDRILGEGLMRYFRQAGHLPELTTNGNAADHLLSCEDYDLIILDLGLPGIDGFEVMRRVGRRGRRIPTLVITARDAVADKILGLNLGADDYLVKPFSLGELEARIRAVLRRGQGAAETLIVCGRLRVDMAGRRTWVDGAPVRLTAREWAVLECLVLRAGKIVSKEQIISVVAGRDGEVSQGVLNVHMSRLRRKLETAGVRIHTVRGLGYCLEKNAQLPD